MEKNSSKKCNEKTEVYCRVCGFFRPVKNFNKGKKQEFSERKNYEFGTQPFLKNASGC